MIKTVKQDAKQDKDIVTRFNDFNDDLGFDIALGLRYQF